MFRRKESPELQVYGKLPLAKDYLRIGASSGASMALRSWLDEGFSGGPRGERQPRLAWPARFIIGSRWGGAPLLGWELPDACALCAASHERSLGPGLFLISPLEQSVCMCFFKGRWNNLSKMQ